MTGQKKFWGLLKGSWLILKSCKLRSLTNLARKPFISGGRSKTPHWKKNTGSLQSSMWLVRFLLLGFGIQTRAGLRSLAASPKKKLVWSSRKEKYAEIPSHLLPTKKQNTAYQPIIKSTNGEAFQTLWNRLDTYLSLTHWCLALVNATKSLGSTSCTLGTLS